MKRTGIRFLSILACCAMSPAIAVGDEVPSKFLPNGVTRKVGGYRPIRAELDKEADIVKVVPDNLVAPKFGILQLGDQEWVVILDEPEDQAARLFVDSNGDRDLTNDVAAEWKRQDNGMYSGSCEVQLADGNNGTIQLYRFDPNDESRKALKNTLLFYSDYGYEYSLDLDGNVMTTFVSGSISSDASLPVDRDGNGKLSMNYERVTLGQPFNFTGTTYVLEVKDGKLHLSKAESELPMMPLPPDLSIGKPVIPFTATTLDGNELDFPKHYAGKIVMMDFWATWCGPCIGEIPHMKEAYKTWNEDGFEILGISFDREDMTEKLNEFLEKNELPWTQIYEGKFWYTDLGKRYDVSAIPFTLLVDGDTGEILGDSRNLRGKGLTDFVGEKLKAKFGDRIQLKPKADDQ